MADGFLQCLGLMRWSYPSEISAFQMEVDSLEALQATLYAPQRMEERLFFLEHMVLPCIRNQTDQSFRMVMLLGAQLPEPYRARVLALISDVPQIVPVFAEEGQKHAKVCRQVMRAHRNKKAAAVAEFRLDDDDAMGIDFIAQTRRHYRANRGLLESHGAFCLDYTKGFALVAGPQGVAVSPIFSHLVGISQALVYPPDYPKSLLDHPHKRLWIAMPNVTVNDPVKWVRGVHQTNDSGIAQQLAKLPTWHCPEEEIAPLLASEFAIDLPSLTAAWEALD